MTIKELIISSNFTTYKLSLDTGIPLSTLQSWASGDRVANLSALRLIFYLSRDKDEFYSLAQEVLKSEQ